MEVVADLGERMLRRFALKVAELVHATPLHGRPRPDLPDGPPQPGVTVDNSQRWRRKPRATRSSRQPFHASKDSPPHSSRARSCLPPSTRTPTTPNTGTLTTFPPLRTRRAKPSR